MKRINAFLWFDSKAEEAAKFYLGIFKNSKIDRITRYGEAGPGPKGSVMTVDFTLDGVRFVALNGGPQLIFLPSGGAGAALAFISTSQRLNASTPQHRNSLLLPVPQLLAAMRRF